MSELTEFSLNSIKYYHFASITLDDEEVIIARMGYTGEDGFEIFCEKDATPKIWNSILELGEDEGLKPAGLGARDTLRLEVNYPLYGNDIDDKHNPYEAGLGWIVKPDKGSFIGKDAILADKESGIRQKLMAFMLDVRGVPRAHCEIYTDDSKTRIGEVTSGTSSPTLKLGIGMGYINIDHAKTGKKISIKIREKFFPATIVKKPFVKIDK